MSEPKIGLAVAQTAMEYRLVRERLWTLCRRAEQIAQVLSTGGLRNGPNSENGRQEAVSVCRAAWLHAINDQPPTAEIQNLADEIRIALRRRHELQMSLRNMGFDPEE